MVRLPFFGIFTISDLMELLDCGVLRAVEHFCADGDNSWTFLFFSLVMAPLISTSEISDAVTPSCLLCFHIASAIPHVSPHIVYVEHFIKVLLPSFKHVLFI